MFNDKRILLISADLNFFSSNKYTLDLFMATRGESMILVEKFFTKGIFSSSELKENEDYKIINTVVIDLSKLPLGLTIGLRLNTYLFRALNKKLIKYLNENNHIVHYTFPRIPPISCGQTHVVTVHDLMSFDKSVKSPWLSKANWRWSIKRYRKFPYVVTPTKYVAKWVSSSGLFDGKITVIPHAVSPYFKRLSVDKVELRRLLGLPLDKKLILSVSSGQPRKNVNLVCEAAERLGPDYKVVRVGPPARNSINFSGVPPERLNMIYNACDLLLFPTTSEGFGYPAIEAMATGLPVVTSDIEVMREVCGDSAVFIEPTVDGAVKGIREALADAQDLIERGLKRAKEFSFERFRENYRKLYDSILKGDEA